MKFVAYYRVSTSRQEKSGLGLAAQKAAIMNFVLPTDVVVAEFVEAASGKNDNRLQLNAAIKTARRHGAKIVIARVDRFSRKVSFIANMMESDVDFVVVDMPNATAFQLHIFAALAQEERRSISSRTKAALAQAKLNGVALGKHGKTLAITNKADARERATAMRHCLPDMWRTMSYSRITQHLNQAGLKTHNGCRFWPQTTKNMIQILRQLEP